MPLRAAFSTSSAETPSSDALTAARAALWARPMSARWRLAQANHSAWERMVSVTGGAGRFALASALGCSTTPQARSFAGACGGMAGRTLAVSVGFGDGGSEAGFSGSMEMMLRRSGQPQDRFRGRPAAAVALGPVHGRVSGHHQLGRVAAIGGEDGNADAETDRPHLARDLERLLHRLQQLDRGGLGAGPVLLGEDHREFVPAEPGQGVGVAERALQAVGEAAQDLVAGLVAELVVDRLEAIEVEDQHRQPAAPAPGAAHRLVEAVVEEAAVGKAGEGVVGGAVEEVELMALAVVDVFDHGNEVVDGAVHVMDRAHGQAAPELGPVLAQVAGLHGHPVTAPGDQLAVVGGLRREVLVGAAVELAGGVAEHAL